MSGLHALTVNTEPTAEPHIYAEDDAAIYQSMFGGDGVCSIGQNCAATVISNNKVRVADGVLCVGGHMARVRYGEYQDCEIMNGQTGYNRNDIIVAKFVTTGTQGTDTYTLEVVQGSAVTGTATDPVLTQGNLYEGEKIRMMPLYRVKIEGLSIVAVEQMFNLIPTIPELQAQVTELNGNLETKIIVETDTYLIVKIANIYIANFIGYTGGNNQLCDAIHMPTQSNNKWRSIVFDDTNRRAVHCYVSGTQFVFYDTQTGGWATGNIFGQIVWQK